MKIEKLPSGSYRVRKMYKGKVFSLTFESKPTNAQVEKELLKRVQESKDVVGNMSFRNAATHYCDSKANVLSPKTLFEYRKLIDSLPQWFVESNIYEIDQNAINNVINEIASKNAPKTVRNKHGFISAVLKTYIKDININTSLPQKKKRKVYIPTDSEARMILEELKGTMFYIPIVLACYGLRRSEVIALKADDIEGNLVHIRSAVVQSATSTWVAKDTKTTESERDIYIPTEIADMIREQGYAYNGSPNSIVCKLHKVQDKLGIKRFALHDFRHYFASKMLTITDRQSVRELGGWKSDAVLMSIYAQALEEEKESAKAKAIVVFNDSLFS